MGFSVLVNWCRLVVFGYLLSIEFGVNCVYVIWCSRFVRFCSVVENDRLCSDILLVIVRIFGLLLVVSVLSRCIM